MKKTLIIQSGPVKTDQTSLILLADLSLGLVYIDGLFGTIFGLVVNLLLSF